MDVITRINAKHVYGVDLQKIEEESSKRERKTG